MERERLIKLVADNALAHLRYDARNPDVGMGMLPRTAVELAEKDVLAEAARWNSLAALSLNFDDIRNDVMLEVSKERKWIR